MMRYILAAFLFLAAGADCRAAGVVDVMIGAQHKTNAAAFNFSQTITSNTTNYNVSAQAASAGWNGTSPLNATITNTVTVGSTSTGAAFIVPSLPAGSTVSLTNIGYIVGIGGTGGDGRASAMPNGTTGGLALSVSYATTINNSGGTIGGGGGGGGGSGEENLGAGNMNGGGGGGGGAGVNNGAAGNGANGVGCGDAGSSGSDGMLLTGGSGGTDGGGANSAGNGGSLGAAGSAGHNYGGSGGGAGGAAGAATSGNSNITWTNMGTIFGALN